MSNPTNQERAARAEAAIVAYTVAKGEQPDPLNDAVDLIADILHLCAQTSTDTDYVLRVAAAHFAHEQEEESNA